MNKRIKKKKAKAKVSFKPMSSEALLRKQLAALEKQIKVANSLKNPTKIKGKTDRTAQRKAVQAIKNNIIKKAKERYEREHQNTTMIREKLSRGEMNYAIRFLYNKGIIKGAFEYYEDFLEQHQNDWTQDDVEQLLNEYEESQEESFNEAIDILKGGTTYVPTKRRNKGKYTLEFL